MVTAARPMSGSRLCLPSPRFPSRVLLASPVRTGGDPASVPAPPVAMDPASLRGLRVMIRTLQRRRVFLSVLRVVLNEDGGVSAEWQEVEFSELSQLL